MKISDEGIEIIKFFESCRLEAYQDSGGVWTVGYGSTRGVKSGMVITQAEADERLREDLISAEHRASENLIRLQIDVNQNEYDTLVSLAYNLRSFEMLASHLKMNRRKFKEKMLLYCKDIKGNFLKGLKIRRIAERLLFEGRKWKLVAKQLQKLNIHEIVEREDELFRQNVENIDTSEFRNGN